MKRLLVALLTPLARANLRAPVRLGMSISGASEEEAGGAVADELVPALCVDVQERAAEVSDSLLLNSCDGVHRKATFCDKCGAKVTGPFLCYPKCGFPACSMP